MPVFIGSGCLQERSCGVFGNNNGILRAGTLFWR